MRTAPLFPLVVLTGLSACGKVVDAEGRATNVDGDAAAETGTRSAAPDTSVPDAAPDSAARYSALVGATLRSYMGTLSHALDISFSPGAPWPPSGPSCGPNAVTVGDCCSGVAALALPVGPPVPLTAGDVTISLRASPLATLIAPDYVEVKNATWSPGDVLGVAAPGGDVAAFSGNLETPVMISGVTPAFGSTTVTISSDADLRVSWTPEAKPGERMQLQIDSIAADRPTFILCAVPDSAGAVLVDASLLAELPTGTTGGIHLTRSITSNALGANVDVALVGEVWLDAPATVK